MEGLLATRFPGLAAPLLRELTAAVAGHVYDRVQGAQGFAQQTRLWNGNLICPSKAVACPVDAHDVSRIVLFCNKHGLSFSVKAGGYAVAGWAVAGDVIIDLCLLDAIDIEPPRAVFSPGQKDWTPLREMPSARTPEKPDKGKGKARAGAMDIDGFSPPHRPSHMLPRADSHVGVGGKRGRASTPPHENGVDNAEAAPSGADLRVETLVKRRKAERNAVEGMGYGGASATVASFLAGAPLPQDPHYPARPQPAGADVQVPSALNCGPAMPDSNDNVKAPGHGVPAPRMPEKAIDDGVTDVDPHNAFAYIEDDPAALIPSFKVHSTPSPPGTSAPSTRSGPLAHDGLAALTSPKHDDTSSTTSSPSSTRSGPLAHGGLSDVTASGTTSAPAPDPFGYLLDGPLGTQASCLAPPALLMRRPPPLPHGFGLSTRAPEALGTIPALMRSSGHHLADVYSSDEDEPAPLQGAIKAGTKPAPNKSAPDYPGIELLPRELRERAETASTALPDGDVALPPPAQVLRTLQEHHGDVRAVPGMVEVAAPEGALDAGADPFGYLSGPAPPREPGSPGVHRHGDGVFERPDPFAYARPALPARASTTMRLADDLGGALALGGALPVLPAAPQPGDDMGGVSNGLPPIPEHPHAYVTFGAGMQQREVDMYTAARPLPAREGAPVPYHVPFAAHPVGSAVMMLGGFGFISRLHGLSTDNLVEVEMVLADGRVVIVSADEHPDLWFALRGAGPAFGIATRYKARAFPVPVVFAGNLIYRFHRATAASLLKHYRDCVKGAPRELYANVLLTAGPADQDSLVVVQMCYAGPRSKGLEFLHALASWDGERCLLNEVGEKAFLAQQDSVAQVLRGQKGRKWFIRSTLVASLPDEVIHQTVAQFADTPVGCTWLMELCGSGAVADTEDSSIPKTQREAAFNCAALHQWDIHVDDPQCVVAAEKWVRETLGPVSTGGPYTCFLGRHEPRARVTGCFGDNWPRLVELKRTYDPRNVFRHNFWPGDAEGDGAEDELVRREPASP